MDYLVLMVYGIALRYVLFSHHFLEGVRRKEVELVSKFSERISKMLEDMYDCPFCNGYWAGLFIFALNYDKFDIVTGALLFPVAVSYVSLLIEEKRKLDDEQYALIKLQQEHFDDDYTSLVLDKHGYN